MCRTRHMLVVVLWLLSLFHTIRYRYLKMFSWHWNCEFRRSCFHAFWWKTRTALIDSTGNWMSGQSQKQDDSGAENKNKKRCPISNKMIGVNAYCTYNVILLHASETRDQTPLHPIIWSECMTDDAWKGQQRYVIFWMLFKAGQLIIGIFAAFWRLWCC